MRRERSKVAKEERERQTNVGNGERKIERKTLNIVIIQHKKCRTY
jgi:hypothetical protein